MAAPSLRVSENCRLPGMTGEGGRAPACKRCFSAQRHRGRRTRSPPAIPPGEAGIAVPAPLLPRGGSRVRGNDGEEGRCATQRVRRVQRSFDHPAPRPPAPVHALPPRSPSAFHFTDPLAVLAFTTVAPAQAGPVATPSPGRRRLPACMRRPYRGRSSHHAAPRPGFRVRGNDEGAAGLHRDGLPLHGIGVGPNCQSPRRPGEWECRLPAPLPSPEAPAFAGGMRGTRSPRPPAPRRPPACTAARLLPPPQLSANSLRGKARMTT